MRDAKKRAVVQEGIAFFDIVEELADRLGRQLQRVDMNGERLFDRHKTMIKCQDATRHVTGILDDARPTRFHDRVGHLTNYRFHATGEHSKQGGIELCLAPARLPHF